MGRSLGLLKGRSTSRCNQNGNALLVKNSRCGRSASMSCARTLHVIWSRRSKIWYAACMSNLQNPFTLLVDVSLLSVPPIRD